MTELPITKTRVAIDDGTIELIDTIRFEEKLWLVPVWIDTTGLKQQQPLLIIRIDQLLLQDRGDGGYVLCTQLPKWIFWNGAQPLPETSLEVRVKPDIWFDYRSEDE